MIQENEHTISVEESIVKERPVKEHPVKGGGINANDVLELVGTFAAVLPLVEAVAPQVLQLYRQIKESGELKEITGEVFGDLIDVTNKIDMASVKRNIAAINAYKAAGISETNAVALRCARYHGKLPDIKVNMNN